LESRPCGQCQNHVQKSVFVKIHSKIKELKIAVWTTQNAMPRRYANALVPALTGNVHIDIHRVIKPSVDKRRGLAASPLYPSSQAASA
jgi:hypothetical protein